MTLLLSDEDFGSLVSGKANAQRLFMAGKLKIRGNVMKATKIEPILNMNVAPPACVANGPIFDDAAPSGGFLRNIEYSNGRCSCY